MLPPGLLLHSSGCSNNRTFLNQLQRVLRPTFLTCLAARSDYKGICRCCALYALSSLGLLMLARPSGFQRPYSLERGAQRTLDCYRGVFSIAAAYVVPIVSSWGLRCIRGMKVANHVRPDPLRSASDDAPRLSRFILRRLLTFPHSCNS